MMTPRYVPYLALLAMGCADFGVQQVRQPAILLFYHNTTTVTVPATVPVGEPAIVTMTSFGGGCISKGETESILNGLDAEVRPYRYDKIDRSPNAACTEELLTFEHRAELRFTEPGTARVRVVGIARPGDSSHVVTRELTVTP